MTASDISAQPPASLAREFARNGAVRARHLIDETWLSQLADAFEALKRGGQDLSNYYGDADSGQPDTGRGQTIVRDDCWRLSDTFLRFIRESPLARWAAAILDSTHIHLFEDLLIFKSAGAEQPTPWHQDEPQWPLAGRKMASAWFCLDPVTSGTGALRFALGTHRGPLYRPAVPPERAADVAADAYHFDGGDLPSVDAPSSGFRIQLFDAEPGDVLFFHPRMLHAALGSAPTYPRRTFSIRMLGDDVRWCPKRSVFHDWLKEIPLASGDELRGERFPLLWPARPT